MRTWIRRYEEVIWWGVALGVILGLALISEQSDVIARDWREIYRPATMSGDFLHIPNVANPPYILLLFTPLAHLPIMAGYIILQILYLGCFRLIAHLSQLNKWLIFPSFPSLWMLVYGQIDALVALGVALGWWAIRQQRPYWQGASTLLLCLKPQVGGPLAIVYLFWQKDRRSLIVSGSTLLLSFIVFGLWPVEWFNRLVLETKSAANNSGFAGTLNEWNNIGIYPAGLLLLPLLLVRYPRNKKIPAIISATLLSSPYAGAYSLLSVMTIPLPLLVYPILSLPLVTQFGYDLIIIVPLVLATYPVAQKLWRIFQKRRKQFSN